MRLDTWIPVNDLIVGDLIITGDNRSSRRIYKFETTFNPRFRPTVFEDDIGYAADLDRHADIKIAARGTWAIDSVGVCHRLISARLLPEMDSKRRSRRAAA